MSRRSLQNRGLARVASAVCAILIAGVYGCGGGVWNLGSLEERFPEVHEMKGHRLGDATPYFFPASGTAVFFLCRWEDGEPIPLSLPNSSEPELREAVDRAARAWEEALGIRFDRRDELSGRGIEIRFADPSVKNVAVSGHAIADCELDLRGEAGLGWRGAVPARLTGASIRLRRVQINQLGREIPLTPAELVGSALHELGHALGYSGHAESGNTVMLHSVDAVRRAGRRLLAGQAFHDPTLRALYQVPSGIVVGRADLRRGESREIDALRLLAVELVLRGPYVNVGDDVARIAWRRPEGDDYPFLIYGPREAAQHPEKILIFPAQRTRVLLEKHR